MDSIKQNSIKAWILAARPKTLTAAAVPVMVALAMAWRDCKLEFSAVSALLCLLFAWVMQIEANFVNDYFDWKKGNDKEETRLGPLRACSMGWVTPRAMQCAMLVALCLAGCIGLPLMFIGGWEMLIVGLACFLFCFLYTICLSYWALGDVLVLLFFGVVPVCCTYYLQTHTVTTDVFVLSVVCGLVVDLLLIINNYRDIDNDRSAGKRTLIVFIGKEWAEKLYFVIGFISWMYLIVVGGKWASISIPFFILHWHTWHQMKLLKGRELNQVLGMTARNIFIFGVTTAIILLMM